MALFSRTKTPTTVAEALASFAILKDQLVEIVRAQVYRSSESEQRIIDAKQYAKDVETNETANIADANAEIERANTALKGLNTLLGGPDQETLRSEQASAHA